MSSAAPSKDIYYVPHSSIWPIVGCVALFSMALGAVGLVNDFAFGSIVFFIGVAILVVMMVGWFGIVIKESESGLYNKQVDSSFRMGMAWFIFSEVMFFAAFFGALFYARQLSVPWLGETSILWPEFTAAWPTAGPTGDQLLGVGKLASDGFFSIIDAWHLPVLNTIILMISSITVTFAHWAIKYEKRTALIVWLTITVLLGCLFIFFQIEEYIEAYTELNLKLTSGIYGTTFFMLTGFHGFHVTIGTIMLFVILLRCIFGHFTAKNHFAFEATAWYWHFVDTVWVILFIFVYIV